jgi:hypothetical protein
VGKGAASSGRLQLFLLTHRGATFAVRLVVCDAYCLHGRVAQHYGLYLLTHVNPDLAVVVGRLCSGLRLRHHAGKQVMADGRDKANPTLHLFDPLGSTLHATNQRAYAITFVGARMDCRAPAEVATASTHVLAPIRHVVWLSPRCASQRCSSGRQAPVDACTAS